jgi:HSP20 family protein
MALIKSTSFPGWSNLTDFFEDDWWKNRLVHNDWIPAVNVIDNDKNYEVEVAAPGFKKEDIHVVVENGVMTISGKTDKEEKENSKKYTRKEFTSKAFSKSFTLPENVDPDHITAKYNDGVLMLTIKKNEKMVPPKKAVAIQ